MAVRPLTITRSGDGSSLLAQWFDLKSGDEGEALELGGWGDRSVQASGDFSGATLSWEGSNDGANYCPLSDPQGNALSLTSNCVKVVAEVCRYSKPKVAGGNGSTNLSVHVFI